MKKSRHYISLFKPITKFANLFGILPNYSFENHELIRETLFVWYIVLLMIAAIGSSSYLVFQRSKYIYPYFYSLFIFMDLFNEIVLHLVFFLAAFRAITGRNQWKELLHHFEYLDGFSELKASEEPSRFMKNATYFLMLDISVSFSIPILGLIISQDAFSDFYYFWSVYFYYFVFTIQFHIFLYIFMYIRHKHEVINAMPMGIHINRDSLNGKFDKVIQYYSVMNKIVHVTNSYFGCTLFNFFAVGSLTVVNMLTYSFAVAKASANGTLHSDLAVISLYGATMIIIKPVVLIFCIDLATREPEKLIKFSKSLERSLDLGSPEHKRVRLFKKQIKEFLPEFTAAGLLRITRTTIYTIVEVIVSHCVVIVQFYLALKPYNPQGTSDTNVTSVTEIINQNESN